MRSVKSNFSHTTLVDEQMYDNMTLPKISVSGSKATRRCSSVNEANEDSDSSTKARKVCFFLFVHVLSTKPNIIIV